MKSTVRLLIAAAHPLVAAARTRHRENIATLKADRDRQMVALAVQASERPAAPAGG